MSDVEKLYQERFERYNVAMNCGKPDRVPIRCGVGEWAAKYTNLTLQEFFYEPPKAVEAVEKIVDNWDIDIFTGGGFTTAWGPMRDAMEIKFFKFPGMHLPENSTFQYHEEEYMKPEDYDDFIANPTEWILNNYMPRVCEEFAEPGSYRANLALIKGAAAMAMYGGMAAATSEKWLKKWGFVPGSKGFTKAPFDTLGDTLRAMKGIMLDIRRRPEKVLAACEALVPHNIRYAMLGAGADTRFPCQAPLHRGAYPFMSLEHWEKFYWPSLKAVIEGLWAKGKRMIFFAEGDWTPYLEKIAELPDTSILFIIDTTDAKKAKEILGGRFCLIGGVPTTLLTYGTPQQVKDCVKRSIDELAGDGGFILSAGGVVMGDAKLENIEAMIEAGREYGKY